jgi:hypothetical protein
MMPLKGTIIATIALASIILPSITNVHWIARALWIFSLLAGLNAVLCSCNQQMTISRRLTSRDLFEWMNDESRADHCKKSEGDDGQHEFHVPDFYAVLLLSLPRKFLHYSLEAYMIGLIIYLGFLWRDQLDEATPGDNRKIFIFSLISLAVCWTVFVVSDITNRCKDSVWKRNSDTVRNILKGPGTACIGVMASDKNIYWDTSPTEESQESKGSC